LEPAGRRGIGGKSISRAAGCQQGSPPLALCPREAPDSAVRVARDGSMNRLRTSLALAVLVVTALSGCLKKASWIANEQGGFTLFANVESVDQAVVRFHRSARDLCGTWPYTLTQPAVVAQNVQGRGWGPPSTVLDVRSELTCNR
jgi:hypothetical protein